MRLEIRSEVQGLFGAKEAARDRGGAQEFCRFACVGN